MTYVESSLSISLLLQEKLIGGLHWNVQFMRTLRLAGYGGEFSTWENFPSIPE